MSPCQIQDVAQTDVRNTAMWCCHPSPQQSCRGCFDNRSQNNFRGKKWKTLFLLLTSALVRQYTGVLYNSTNISVFRLLCMLRRKETVYFYQSFLCSCFILLVFYNQHFSCPTIPFVSSVRHAARMYFGQVSVCCEQWSTCGMLPGLTVCILLEITLIRLKGERSCGCLCMCSVVQWCNSVFPVNEYCTFVNIIGCVIVWYKWAPN